MVTLGPTHADDEDWVRPIPGSARLRLQDFPQWVGPYRIQRELGRGVSGLVLLAERGGRLVAVKLLEDRAPDALERFQAQARAASRLCDPGIVSVLNAGVHEGRAYCAMEFCAGRTLQQHLRQGPLSPRHAAELIRELARAISVAHRAKVLHRDLKPANVILERGTDQPRITDFGLAQDRTESGTLTRSGDVIGPPLYMAPEVFEGAEQADQRSDIYALGVMFYECLTGRLPYAGRSVLEQALLVRRGDAPPPRLFEPQVPRHLEVVCMTALALDPADRYAQASAMVDALDGYLIAPAATSRERFPTPQQPPAVAAVASTGPRRTLLVWGALAAASLYMLGALLWAGSGEEPPPVAAVAASPAESPPVVVVVEVEEAPPPFQESLSACRRALAASDLSAWETAVAAAQAGAAKPGQREELEAFLGGAWRERHDVLRASMREVEAFDPQLVRRSGKLVHLFPSRAGETILLLSEYHRRRANYDEALMGARRLREEHGDRLGAEGLRLQVLCHWLLGHRARRWGPLLDELIRERGPAGAYGRALSSYVRGNSEQALRACEQALKLEAGYLPAKILKVWLLGRGGDYEGAESFEATFAAEAEDDPYLLMERLRRRFEQGLRYQGLEVAPQLRLLVEDRDPQLGETLGKMQRVLRQFYAQNMGASRRLHDRPGDLEARVLRGVSSLVLGELDRSCEDLRQARDADPARFAELLAESQLSPAERVWVEAQIGVEAEAEARVDAEAPR